AVVARVIESGRHRREATPQRVPRGIRSVRDRAPSDYVRGAACLVVHTAGRAVGDQQLVVPLTLRRPRCPPLAGLEERRDLVLVTILITGLDPDDEGHGHAPVG